MFGPVKKVGNVVVGDVPYPDFSRLVTEPRINDPATGLVLDPPDPNVEIYDYVLFDVAFDPQTPIAQSQPLIAILTAIEYEIRSAVMPPFQALKF